MKLTLVVAGILLAGFALVQGQGVRIDVDTSRAPDLAAFGRRVKAELERMYPEYSRLLHSPTFRPVRSISIFFDPNFRGVAGASASARRIVGSVAHCRSNQDDVGSMIHEMIHVIQQYPGCPSWITEGVADWVRYWLYEPTSWKKPGKPAQGSTFRRDVYRVAPYFLNYINERHRNVIPAINRACREGTYNDSIFRRLTDKTVDQLWNEMMRSRG